MQHLICDVRYICGSFYFDLKTPVMKLTSTIRKERQERCKLLKDQAMQRKVDKTAIRRPPLFHLTSMKRFKCTLLNTHILSMADYDSKPSRWIFTGRRKLPISHPKHNDLYKGRVSSTSPLQITSSQTAPPPAPSPPLSFIISILLQMKLIR